MSYTIEVQFCMKWNYAPKAASFAEQLFAHFRAEITKLELVPSSGGAFEVFVNGTKIYSKLETGSFPETDHILNKMENVWAFINWTLFSIIYWKKCIDYYIFSCIIKAGRVLPNKIENGIEEEV